MTKELGMTWSSGRPRRGSCGRVWHTEPERPMTEIKWRREADAALEEAKRRKQPVLLDFSAAPM